MDRSSKNVHTQEKKDKPSGKTRHLHAFLYIRQFVQVAGDGVEHAVSQSLQVSDRNV